MIDLPCTILFQNGVEVHRINGAQGAENILKDLKSFF